MEDRCNFDISEAPAGYMEHCIEQHPVRMPFDQLNAHRYFAQTGQFAETGYSYQFLFLVKLKALLIIAVGRYCMASANYVLPRVAMHLVIYKTKQAYGSRILIFLLHAWDHNKKIRDLYFSNYQSFLEGKIAA